MSAIKRFFSSHKTTSNSKINSSQHHENQTSQNKSSNSTIVTVEKIPVTNETLDHEEIKEDTLKEDEKPAKPWETILIGLGLIAFGIFLYYTFNNLEQEGGSLRINWLFALAYNIGGKWTVAVIVTLIGVFTTYSGFSALKSKPKE